MTAQLAVYNPSGSNLIDHIDVDGDVGGSVDSGIPEFPSAITIGIILVLVIAAAVVFKRIGKPKNAWRRLVSRLI